MIRVMIADDHLIVRKGLVEIVKNEIDLQVSIEAESGDDVVKYLNEDSWDIMVLDIAMPGKNALELIHLAKYYHPKKAILILSGYPEEKFGIRMIKAGANGYLNKGCSPSIFVDAIRACVSGGSYITSNLASLLVKELHVGDLKKLKHTLLTDREFQVFMLLSKGQRLTDIASSMALSVKTVSTYRSRLLEKMGFTKNAELVEYAIVNHLIDEISIEIDNI